MRRAFEVSYILFIFYDICSANVLLFKAINISFVNLKMASSVAVHFLKLHT